MGQARVATETVRAAALGTLAFCAIGCVSDCQLAPMATGPSPNGYRTCYVAPVAVDRTVDIEPGVLEEMHQRLVWRLRATGTFAAVAGASPGKEEKHLCLQARVTQYEPGSYVLRCFAPFVGPAKLRVAAQLLDGQTGSTLAEGSAREYWDVPGPFGAMKNIDTMRVSACNNIANEVERICAPGVGAAPEGGQPKGSAP